MSYETVPAYERLPELGLDESEPYQYQERLIQRLEEPQTPVECLGGIALNLIVGGAIMTGGGGMPGTELMPDTEALVIEGLVGINGFADSQANGRLVSVADHELARSA